MKYKKEEIEENLEEIKNLISNEEYKFIFVKNYKPKSNYGEVQDVVFYKCHYKTIIEKSLEVFNTIESDEKFNVVFNRGVWCDDEGNVNPTNRKTKIFLNYDTVTEGYERGDELLETAIETIKSSLVKENTQDNGEEDRASRYEKLGDHLYKDSSDNLFIGDLVYFDKKIVVAGDYPPKASSVKTCIEKEIRKKLLIDRYRIFPLDSDYEYIEFLTKKKKA